MGTGPCQLCETRKPRRTCPAVRGDICAICCGEQREVTLDCPLDCEYLREARLRDKLPDVDPDKFPNQDVRVTEFFLRENGPMLLFLSRSLLAAAIATPGACDHDIKEAFESLIKTYRTLESGLIYETRPSNPYAATIQERIQEAIQEYRQQVQQATGLHSVRDAQILGLLVFLQRMEIQHNNGRRRGRAFLSFLLEHFPADEGPRHQGLLLA
jgi:hypothetical protein